MPNLPANMDPRNSFQGLILTLQQFWANQGCVILQPYDMQMGAGTFHTATTLRALGPKPWSCAYVQPSRRPKDGRYGENPNRLQHYYQFQVILKPSPDNIQDLYLQSLKEIGLDSALHDIRFVEDDWESPTLGAWGLGWECWCDGMEVSQFTYFQQVAGFECNPVPGEITYGLERLAMYVQGVENVYDLNFNGGGNDKVTYGDVFLQNEQEQSRYNFEFADTDMLFRHFADAEAECKSLLEKGQGPMASTPRRPRLRAGHQGLAQFQPARRPRRHLGHRTPELHPAHPRTGQSLRRRLAADGRRRRLAQKALVRPHAQRQVDERAHAGGHEAARRKDEVEAAGLQPDSRAARGRVSSSADAPRMSGRSAIAEPVHRKRADRVHVVGLRARRIAVISKLLFPSPVSTRPAGKAAVHKQLMVARAPPVGFGAAMRFRR